MIFFQSANDKTLDRLLNTPRPVILDFSSPTCTPCRLIEPELKKIQDKYANKLTILKVNVNESPKTCASFSIRGVPTLLFIKNKKVHTQLIGAVKEQQIEQKLMTIL